MKKESLDFLRHYMGSISPSGFEEEASLLWRKQADRFAERTRVDVHVN